MAVDWTIVDEIRLFRWISEFKPAGIHKHFNMICIVERMNRPDKYPVTLLQKEHVKVGKLFTAQDIWDRLSRYYNLKELDAMENNIPDEKVTSTNNDPMEERPGEGGGILNDINHNSNIDEEYHEGDSGSNEEDMALLKLRYKMQRQTRDFALPWGEYGELILANAKKGAISEGDNEQENEQELKIIQGTPKLEAVSYTHLDVYKRQTKGCLAIRSLCNYKC